MKDSIIDAGQNLKTILIDYTEKDEAMKAGEKLNLIVLELKEESKYFLPMI